MSENTYPWEPTGSAEWRELIEKVLHGSQEERNDAWRKLEEEYILPLANQVGVRRCFNSQAQEEFIAEAPGHVFKKLNKFDLGSGSFPAWCYRVLANLAIDMGRARKCRKATFFSKLEPEDGSESIEEILGLEARPLPQNSLREWFGREGVLPWQMEILEGMPPLRRVIAVAAAGLHVQVPAERWEQWLEEADVEPGFPPGEIYQIEEPTERLPLIASALGMGYQAVRQHWYRSLEALKKLFEERRGRQ